MEAVVALVNNANIECASSGEITGLNPRLIFFVSVDNFLGISGPYCLIITEWLSPRSGCQLFWIRLYEEGETEPSEV